MILNWSLLWTLNGIIIKTALVCPPNYDIPWLFIMISFTQPTFRRREREEESGCLEDQIDRARCWSSDSVPVSGSAQLRPHSVVFEWRMPVLSATVCLSNRRRLVSVLVKIKSPIGQVLRRFGHIISGPIVVQPESCASVNWSSIENDWEYQWNLWISVTIWSDQWISE